jgi:hypothetical protein
MSSRKEFEVVMRRWFQSAAGGASPAATLLPLALDVVQIAQNEMIRRDVATIRESQRRSDEMLSALSEHTREFEKETSDALREQTDRLADLEDSTNAALLVTAAVAREDVLRERSDRLRDIGRLDDAVGALVADHERARDAAERWLTDARTLAAVIAATLPHEDYRPRALGEVDARLAIVAANLDQGFPDAALSLAQDAYQTLSDLRLDLELRHREWLAGRWEAARSMTVVKELIARARLMPLDLMPADVTDETEPAGPLEVDLDRRSTARLGELGGEVDAILASLQDGAPRLTLNQVRDVITVHAPQLQDHVEQTIAVAWQRVQASQMRANLADVMAEFLQNGFLYHTEQAGYEDGDPTGSFTARLLQPMSENEIVLHVHPAGEDALEVNVEIESFARTLESDQVRRERAAAISKHLRDQGLDVGDPREVVPGEAIPRGRPADKEPDVGVVRASVRDARPIADSQEQ